MNQLFERGFENIMIFKPLSPILVNVKWKHIYITVSKCKKTQFKQCLSSVHIRLLSHDGVLWMFGQGNQRIQSYIIKK